MTVTLQRSAALFSAATATLLGCAGEPPPPRVPAPTTAVPPPATGSSSQPLGAQTSNASDYPPSRRDGIREAIHGVPVADPYRWLEDGQSDETRAWTQAQDTYARTRLSILPGRDAIAARLKALYYVDTPGIPEHRGTRYFVALKRATDEKAIVYVREGKSGPERVLLNPNEWAKDGSSSLGTMSPSHDGRYVAYSVKSNNSDEATLYVIDVATGKKLEKDVIEGAKYASASWTPEGDGFFYVWLPTDPSIKTSERPGYAELRFHKLGQEPAKDLLVRERTGDPTTFLSGNVSHDGKFLFHEIQHGWASNEVFYRDAHTPSAPWIPLAPGIKAHFAVEAYRGQLYVTTDDGAPRKRLFRVDPRAPQRGMWKELIAEPKDETLEDASICGGKLAVHYLKNATGRLELRALDGTAPKSISLPGLGSISGVSGLPDDDESWFSYTSFTEPMSTFELSLKSGTARAYSAVKVPFDTSPFTTTQVSYPSKDGTPISMFLVHRKDRKPGTKGRAFLYGYGGFQVVQSPGFTATIVPWLEQGGIYAVTNLRGGGEYGEDWHRNGMLAKKQNTFDDFIGAAEYLVREGYTDPTKLAIAGGSNGGLLMGAAMTQRPDLFAAVLCSVPLLDMVRYHLFGSGKTWVGEYGSADDPGLFKALFAYSPYHHVGAAVRYPALLMLGADSDDRVDPMHARKFIAEVQGKSAGGPAWLRVEKNSGHGGADLRKAEVEKNADRLAFALRFTAAP
jgi:prolyl oligopeptidase